MIDASIAMPPAQTGEPDGAVNADALLQASRRLDWRFLLPTPDLGRVAYVGVTQPALVGALKLFASQVELYESAAAGKETIAQARGPRGVVGLYDLVVAHTPDAAALRQAAALVRPGGWLYLEARRRLTQHLAALQRLGMEHAAAYWIWPNFEACTKIIPVDHLATVARFQTAQLRPARFSRLLGDRLAPRLAASHTLQDAIPCVGIVAQRGPAPLGEGGLR